MQNAFPLDELVERPMSRAIVLTGAAPGWPFRFGTRCRHELDERSTEPAAQPFPFQRGGILVWEANLNGQETTKLRGSRRRP
jgi:hypothetical protein